MEEAEALCVQHGISDMKFVCSIALHRFIREDEFRHICGRKLYDKYWKSGRMFNFNAVDEEFSKHIGAARSEAAAVLPADPRPYDCTF